MSSSAPRLRILVAEDDAHLRGVVMDALERKGHACEAAASAAELETAFQRRPPDVLICDVSLGDGDGIELCSKLRQHRPGLRVLIMTGSGPAAARARREGFGALLAKPFTLDELSAALGSLA